MHNFSPIPHAVRNRIWTTLLRFSDRTPVGFIPRVILRSAIGAAWEIANVYNLRRIYYDSESNAPVVFSLRP